MFLSTMMGWVSYKAEPQSILTTSSLKSHVVIGILWSTMSDGLLNPFMPGNLIEKCLLDVSYF